MKTIIFLSALLSGCIFQSLSAQTITLLIAKDCSSSIRLNGKILSNDGNVIVPATKGKGISFKLQNPFRKNILIGVKGTSPNTKLNIVHFEKQFESGNTVETDNNLNLTISRRKQSLREPFTLFLGCSNEPDKAVSTTLSFSTQGADNTTDNDGKEDIIQAESGQPENEPEYKPGSAVYDALKLADKEKLTEYEYKKIIQFYFPDIEIDDGRKASEAVQANPFLKQVFDTSFEPVKDDNITAESGGSILSKLSLSSVGGLDVTSIADGLAKFLVKRAKEELSISFFQRLKKTLDSIPDLQTLFPATVNLLSSAGDDVYDYKTYIQNLRESFKKDINSLDENLPGIVINHPLLFDSAHHHTLAAALRSGCYFAGELKRQVHPGDILANYPVGYLKYENKNWMGSIQTLQLLSASLRDTSSEDSTYWVSIKYVRQMVNDRTALKIYFGLLYQNALNNYNSIPFDKGTFTTLLNDFAARYDAYDEAFTSYRLYIMRFAEKTETLNKMIKNYTKPENDSSAIELYKKYFDATADMIDYTSQVGELPFINDNPFIAGLHTTLLPYLDITKAVSDLVIDINRKNYSSAINHTVYIYSKVRTRPSQMEAISLQNNQVVNNTTASARLTYKPAVDSFAHSENALNKLVKYGAFMAAVSTAQNSDEVESAIEAFALPAGSSFVKRSSSFNVSVNAYAGLFYGIEKIKDFDKKNTSPNVYGVTAPVGIAASWGRRLLFVPTGTHQWSTSLFISLIDLGAVTAFRFKDSAAETVPTIQLKDIVSPGAFLSIGIPRTQLSFNFGAQAGPNLRKVTSLANDYSNKMYWRYSVSLCVDIPLLNLYTR